MREPSSEKGHFQRASPSACIPDRLYREEMMAPVSSLRLVEFVSSTLGVHRGIYGLFHLTTRPV